MPDVGVVVIGRNEGERLRRCLQALPIGRIPVVYVDSHSMDGSAALARALGVDVVELDVARPLSAALARNAGLHRILELAPDLEFVQFVDGDSIIREDWFEQGMNALRTRREVAVVAGNLHERFPRLSIYNRLCEREWQAAAGEVEYCGGNAMIRVTALRTADGFDGTVPAAEDTELCGRLRLHGWKILHVGVDMGWHDAAMTRFGQWWRRCIRTGQAYAQVACLHRRSRIALFARQTRSVWVWAGIIPTGILVLLWPTRGLSLLALAVYPLQACRIYRRERIAGAAPVDALLYAVACVLAKFPELVGQLRFHLHRLRGREHTLVEHKRTPPFAPPAALLEQCADASTGSTL